jgi:hypothetical protein
MTAYRVWDAVIRDFKLEERSVSVHRLSALQFARRLVQYLGITCSILDPDVPPLPNSGTIAFSQILR